MRKLDRRGFSVIEVVIVIIVLAGVGFAASRIISKRNESKQPGGKAASELKKDCQGSGEITLTHAPMDMNDVASVLPAGTLAGAHVTPIDHLYFYPKDMKNRDAAPVYAMADGFIVSYQERTQRVDDGSSQKGEYRIDIQHNCSVFSYFDLMTSLDSSIADKVKGGKNLHVPVKAGQEIGRVGAQSLDTAVYNYDKTLKGFVNPDSYVAEPWKIHLDDFFAYFKDPIRGEMLAKNPRKVEPYGGKIDYDIDGKLVGNWFQEGTYGYAGAKEQQNVAGSDGRGYWSGHFSIAPDAVTPSKINVSFGDYQGKAQQFTAVSGSVDPASVGVSAGNVKIEYSQYMMPGGPDMEMMQQGNMNMSVQGTVLFQMLEDRKMKMEAFPGKASSQVSGFTSAAKVYVR